MMSSEPRTSWEITDVRAITTVTVMEQQSLNLKPFASGCEIIQSSWSRRQSGGSQNTGDVVVDASGQLNRVLSDAACLCQLAESTWETGMVCFHLEAYIFCTKVHCGTFPLVSCEKSLSLNFVMGENYS
ncbi:hypothetical protein AcW1_008517 [Taiwanofungus camphoratus]|nr:hypothetical protein AcV5_008805 [Antrodia cinnamomea]KAI0951483.1 hypothetical protein AcW1_008517 [Antrodia cinnamomea]